MTIGKWLADATQELVDSGSSSARLDAEIILSHTIRQPRTYLHAHLDEDIDDRQEEIANARLDLRTDHVPIAYIIGHKEFYGRRFIVTPSVLVPRPESEELIELLRSTLPTTQELLPAATKRLVDIGTGSGVLGITAKLEFPELDVTLLDNSRSALAIAEKNAAVLEADVHLELSNLLDNYAFTPDIVLANLPYVDESWPENSEELRHEPAEALYASRHGLSLVETCLEQLATRLRPGAIAIFEADPRQWPEITRFALGCGFEIREQRDFVVLLVRKP